MQKQEVTHRFLRLPKLIALAVCFVILFSSEVVPLHAQLTPARDLTGTWQSSIAGTYYEMDPSDPTTRMNDLTATFAMDITQSGSQIDIILSGHWTQWSTDAAYWNELGISGVPPVGDMSIEFVGTVSSSSFSADEVGSQLTEEHLSGTFTSNIITATLSGTAETTDQNGIVVTLTSSGTAPTTAPTSPSTTGQQSTSRYNGNIASVKGQAWTIGNSGNTPLPTGQIVSGTAIQTGSNGIVGFEPPNQGGTVYLGANSDGGWVGLTSKPAPDSTIPYVTYTPANNGVIFPNGPEQLSDLKKAVPLDVAIAVLVFSEPLGQAIAVGLIIEGGAFLIPNGIAYVKETVSHLLVVPQGGLIGGNTEYTVSVSEDGTTTVQVIDGPVYFLDPVTNNTVTVNSNQELALPPAQAGGFSQTELQGDVSTLDSSSVNHWWTQAASSGGLSLNGLLSLPVIAAVGAVVAIIVVVAAVASVMRKRKMIKQMIRESESKPAAPTPMPTPQNAPTFKMEAAPAPVPQPPPQQVKTRFCPNCGQQLPQSRKFCPFCGLSLNTQENKEA